MCGLGTLSPRVAQLDRGDGLKRVCGVRCSTSGAETVRAAAGVKKARPRFGVPAESTAGTCSHDPTLPKGSCMTRSVSTHFRSSSKESIAGRTRDLRVPCRRSDRASARCSLIRGSGETEGLKQVDRSSNSANR
jgi:hypothetical protein